MKINEIDDFDIDQNHDITGFKKEAVQAQLMKVVDSEPSDEIKNPVRTVQTDDGKDVRVEHGEAVAILKMLSAPAKPEQKIQLQKLIQNEDGLQKVIDYVNAKGMVK